MKRYRFLREALEEYEDAVSYYERARSGLGDTFVREVERVIELTLEFPEMGAPVADTPPELGVRRRLVRRSTSRSITSYPAIRSSCSRCFIASDAPVTGKIGFASSDDSGLERVRHGGSGSHSQA